MIGRKDDVFNGICNSFTTGEHGLNRISDDPNVFDGISDNTNGFDGIGDDSNGVDGISNSSSIVFYGISDDTDGVDGIGDYDKNVFYGISDFSIAIVFNWIYDSSDGICFIPEGEWWLE